jgi:ornithine--oxo-acid transaminase
MVENSARLGPIFKSELEKIKSPLFKEVRGRGLFIGVEIKAEKGISVDGNHFAKVLMKHGILTKATHDSTVRLTPPLIIKESEIY